VLITKLAPALAPLDGIAVGERREPVSVRVAEPTATRSRITADIDEDMVLLIWPMPPRYGAHGVAALTVVDWLDGALRLELRRGKLGAGFATMLGGPRAPYLLVGVERGSHDAAKVLDDVVAVAARMWDSVDADSAFAVRQAAIRALFRGLDDEAGRSYAMADYAQFDPDTSMSSDVARLEQLGYPQLVELTRATITRERAALVEVQAAAAGGDVVRHLRGAFREPPPPVAAPEAAADRSAFENRVELTRFTLPSGLEVGLAPRYFTPLVHARLVIPGGGTVGAANPAVARHAAAAIDPPDDGVGRYGQSGVLFETPLADFSGHADAFTTTFEATALAGWQDVIVWGLARTMIDGDYTRASVQRLHAQAKQDLRAVRDPERERSRDIARWWRAARLGDAHPTVTAPPITGQHLAAVDLQALRTWHRQHHRPAGALLVLTGHFSASLMRRHIEVAFADWTGGDAVAAPAATPAGRRTLAVFDDHETHLSIELEVPLILAEPLDEAVAQVAAELLHERLWKVRDRLGAAYHFDAELTTGMTPAISVGGQIDVRFVPEVMAMVSGALAELRAGTIDADALERARRRATRVARARLAVADGIAERLVQAHRLGRAPGHDAAVVAALQDTDAAGLARAISAAAARGEHLVLRGPRGAVSAGFKALGLTADATID
jgi:predicted Zn-dependent peptidase